MFQKIKSFFVYPHFDIEVQGNTYRVYWELTKIHGVRFDINKLIPAKNGFKKKRLAYSLEVFWPMEDINVSKDSDNYYHDAAKIIIEKEIEHQKQLGLAEENHIKNLEEISSY